MQTFPAYAVMKGGICFAAAFHNFVPPVAIVALGPTNFGIKGIAPVVLRRDARLLCGFAGLTAGAGCRVGWIWLMIHL
ncbi:hypothetical protein A7J57_12215 [Agrobacterium tumefaciens]|uniref:Uncharacterized protein n=1 Tax=Agrobacterium tumefaciens TaxID=358 RepID=A0A176XDR2_AGRTU|nr:hypothetical protein A7J57_12215 [Agrobacterium tumefaciens]